MNKELELIRNFLTNAKSMDMKDIVNCLSEFLPEDCAKITTEDDKLKIELILSNSQVVYLYNILAESFNEID